MCCMFAFSILLSLSQIFYADDLENDAVEARQEVADCRSKYPNICSNILMKTVKCDIKTSVSTQLSVSVN